jgi:hypothetical protein
MFKKSFIVFRKIRRYAFVGLPLKMRCDHFSGAFIIQSCERRDALTSTRVQLSQSCSKAKLHFFQNAQSA